MTVPGGLSMVMHAWILAQRLRCENHGFKANLSYIERWFLNCVLFCFMKHAQLKRQTYNEKLLEMLLKKDRWCCGHNRCVAEAVESVLKTWRVSKSSQRQARWERQLRLSFPSRPDNGKKQNTLEKLNKAGMAGTEDLWGFREAETREGRLSSITLVPVDRARG